MEDTHIHFLVDTGSCISVLPLKYAKNIQHTSMKLSAANGTNIKTYGTSMSEIVIPLLRRKFKFKFYVAEVVTPIIGADFLVQYSLLVDMKRMKIVDNETSLTVACIAREKTEHTNLCSLQAFDAETPTIVTKLLLKYPSINKPFTAHNIVKHSTKHHVITTGPPMASRVRPLYGDKLAAAKEEFEKLVENGVARKSESPWTSPIHLVPKGESWRVCGDYRRLNNVTEKDAYPMPNINALYSVLHGSKIFTNLDLVRGYNQIPMEENSIPKTAVITPTGLFEYLRLPFGLCNATKTFQRFMDELFSKLPFVFVYLDDILIFSKSEDDHGKHLEEVFKVLENNGLKISSEKCHFFRKSIKFLGHTVSSEGIQPSKQKCEALEKLNMPTTYLELQKFLGAVSFYRKYIQNYAEHEHPLRMLLSKAPSKNASLTLSDKEMVSFEKLKLLLSNVASQSFIDPNSNIFTVTTDASTIAIGGVLHQVVNSESRLIMCYSRKLKDCETRYSTFDRELLAMHDSV